MLILNMGSTSTKISVYDGYEKIAQKGEKLEDFLLS